MTCAPKRRELSLQVIEAIATHEGVDQTDIDPPLHDVIDLEALDALFDKQLSGGLRGEGTITFPYNGYNVSVSSSGDVEILDNSD